MFKQNLNIILQNDKIVQTNVENMRTVKGGFTSSQLSRAVSWPWCLLSVLRSNLFTFQGSFREGKGRAQSHRALWLSLEGCPTIHCFESNFSWGGGGKPAP